MKKKPGRPYHAYSTGRPELDREIRALVAKARGKDLRNNRYLEDIMITGFKLIEDAIDQADVRMLTIALKELRYAFKVFLPYEHCRKVALFGSARVHASSKDYKLAKSFAQRIVREGWMVITGAASGIMSAGNEGAGRENSFGVNIQLPFEQEANETIADDQKLINFKYFFTRKLIFMRESDATLLFPGGFGTHDEGFETLTLVQTGKAVPRPVVCMDPRGSRYWKSFLYFLRHEMLRRRLIDREDLDLIYYTHDPREAVNYITRFYSNYHSSRYIRDQFVIRLKRPLPADLLERLNKRYKDLVETGKIEQFDRHFPEEEEEPSSLGLHRLAFHFKRRHFARLHALIREINQV